MKNNRLCYVGPGGTFSLPVIFTLSCKNSRAVRPPQWTMMHFLLTGWKKKCCALKSLRLAKREMDEWMEGTRRSERGWERALQRRPLVPACHIILCTLASEWLLLCDEATGLAPLSLKLPVGSLHLQLQQSECNVMASLCQYTKWII